MKLKIDLSRLLGFRLETPSSGTVSTKAKIGREDGVKAGIKAGTKIGTKTGTKFRTPS